MATIVESVKKTGRVVIVEEGPKTGSVSAEIAAGIIGSGKARIGYLHAGALQEAQKVKELVEVAEPVS